MSLADELRAPAVDRDLKRLDEERYLETFTQSLRRRSQKRSGPWRPSNNSREAPSVCAVMLIRFQLSSIAACLPDRKPHGQGLTAAAHRSPRLSA